MIKTEKYLENNLLLAKFMGCQLIFDDLQNYPDGYWHHETSEMDYPLDIVDSQFHNSWNWLMPVVRRCVEIACDESQEMFMSKQYTMLLDIVPMADIEETYKAVVEFVKKYNSK